ncbi:MAG: LuxR C-terminal-related transcriptional regulator [Synergistaceae bacterium]|jgi:LuxR family maltose regulon positive regulatory protein|nr:LuxR C-terminal-related transcriptional regulator [Synergistaceae bacterium]
MNEHIFNRGLTISIENKTFLERPRINRILADAIKKPLIIVTAGAGYGKTLEVYSFLRNYDAPTMWFQLSERDNVGARFWENFANTIALYNRRFAERLLAIGFPEAEDQFEKYISMIEDQVSPAGKRVMVFDDFHLIREKPVFQFIERSIKSPFPNITTIIISRTYPEINTVRLLSHGMVAAIDEEDLRLTEGETARYFQLLGIPLPPQSAANVYSDTAGWVFAINLVSLALKKAPTQEQSARAAMKLNIFKMMENEVFLVSSERLRRFLVKLSLIDHLSAELVSILAGGDETLVGELKMLSSFVRLDIYLHAYFIHHLFLDYLRQKQNILREDEKHDVYLKAARWCCENDYKMDAISYYDKVGEYEAIIDIVYNFSIQFTCDQAKFILDIYNKAPAHLLECFARYHRQYSTLLLSLNMYDEAVANIKERIAKYSALPSSDFNNHVLCDAYMSLGITRYLTAPYTDHYDFYEPLEKADRYYRMSPYHESGAATSVTLSALVSKVGTTRSGAMEEFIDSLALAIPSVANILDGCMYGLDDLARGELLFYRSSLNDSVKFLKKAFQKAEERNQYEVRNRALLYLLRISVAKGDYGEIQTIFKNLEAQLDMKEYHSRFTTFDIVASWYYSLINQPNMIAHWILSGDFGKGSLGIFKTDFGNLAKAKFYYSDKRYHELISFLESKPTFCDALFGKLEMKVLMAASQYQLKNRDASMALLEEAYELASTNSLLMPFIELGKDMRTLTRAAMRDKNRGIPAQWLETVNRKSATYAKRLLQVIMEYKKANNIKDNARLSAKEMEILRDLYDGLSRTEIASNRELSVSTVKMVLNTIYAKLGANSLADVIRIAINRNLIKK